MRQATKQHSPFDYSSADAVLQAWLREAAEIFESRPETAVESVSAGRVLADVKTKLGHGLFMSWCRTESSWSHTQITKLIRAANVFGEIEIAKLSQFDRSALYLLLKDKLPAAARESAIAEAAAGRRITFVRAQQIAGTFIRHLGPRINGQTLNEPEEESPASPLSAILEQFDSIYIHVIRDENGDVEFTGHAVDSIGGKRRTAARETPELTIAALAGLEPTKCCTRCGVEYSIGEFTQDRREAGFGKGSWCRRCERDRGRRNTRLRAAKKNQARRAAGGSAPAAKPASPS